MSEPLLQVKNVSRSYRTVGTMLDGGSGSLISNVFNNALCSRRSSVAAVNNVSLTINSGDVVGLVGESGSGKSTLARMIMGLEKPDSGSVLVNGLDIHQCSDQQLRQIRRSVQMVFQNPYAALNPLQRIDAAIVEPRTNFETLNQSQRQSIALAALKDVGLPQRLLHAYPHQLSGGERQRVCIARALTVKPQLLVCDEAVSALDKTVQAQVLTLLRQLQQRHGLAILFISHDLAAVNQLCDQLLVMREGDLVERGDCDQLLSHTAEPDTQKLRHPYTQKLLQANRFLEGVRCSIDVF